MTQKQYDYWAKLWSLNRPDKNVPTKEQAEQLMNMFGFTAKSIGIPEDSEIED